MNIWVAAIKQPDGKQLVVKRRTNDIGLMMLPPIMKRITAPAFDA